MTTSELFRFTLSGPGVDIDKEVDQALAAALMQIVLGGLVATPANGPTPLSPPAHRQRPALSLREFIDEVSARSNPAKITAFGIYGRDFLGQPHFSKDEIKTCFKSAGESLPANFARDFGSAIQKGWISVDHEKPDQYYITRRGDDAVKQGSPD